MSMFQTPHTPPPPEPWPPDHPVDPDDRGAVMLAELTALEVERARLEARISSTMVAFAEHRRAESAHHDDPRVRAAVVSFAADEIAAAVRMPAKVVTDRITHTRRLMAVMPHVWQAATAGLVDAWRGRVIIEHATKLTQRQNVVDLDQSVLDATQTMTITQAKAWLRRFVIRREPDAFATRRTQALADRRVWVEHADDGTAWLHALMGSEDAMRLDRLATTQGKKLLKNDTTGDLTLDQARSDALVGLWLEGSTGQTVIAVTVPVTSLGGMNDTPGEAFDGTFALPPDVVNKLTHDSGALIHRIMTDPLGRVLEVTQIGHDPTPTLRTAIEALDATCPIGTCTKASIDCDKDHVTPYDAGGPTGADNLRSLCRRHHRMKTLGIITTTYADGIYTWTMPDGTTHTRTTRQFPPAA